MVKSAASQKGGGGKMTLFISPAVGLAHRGKRVLRVDSDIYASSAKVLAEKSSCGSMEPHQRKVIPE